MTVRGPGIKPRTKVNELVGNIDVPATLLQLSGARVDYEVDGRPLGRFWRNPQERTRRPFEVSLFTGKDHVSPFPSEAGGASISAKAPAVSYRSYRVGPYKYIRYRTGERELYDLKRDPYELKNRIGRPRYAAVEFYMSRYFDQVTNCSGSGCREELPAWPEPWP